MNRKRVVKRALLCGLLLGLLALLLKGTGEFRRSRMQSDLVAASSNGDTATVTRLLEKGANPNAAHLEGSSALWWAVQSGSLATVQALLSHGANPNSRGQFDSVLDLALSQSVNAQGTAKEPVANAIVRALIRSGAETASVHNAVERLARERYLFVKRLYERHGVTLCQQTFVAEYALFPVGRYDSVYILSSNPDDTGDSYICRYDREAGRDKLVYQARFKSTWNPDSPSEYKGPTKNLLQVAKCLTCVPVGKMSRFARNDLSREQELVRYTWIPYIDTVSISLSSKGFSSVTQYDADTDVNKFAPSLLGGNLIQKFGLPIATDEFAILKKRDAEKERHSKESLL